MNTLFPTRRRRQTTFTLVGLAFLLMVVVGFRMCVGSRLGWPGGRLDQAFWRLLVAGWWEGVGFDSVLDIRLNRVALAVLAGSSLATGGVALQALLRNPLAEPFILGLSSGAGVGVMAQMWAAHRWGFLLGHHHLGALLGASVSMLIVYVAGQRRGVIDPLGLLLVGVVLGTLNGAVMVLMNHLSGSVELRNDLARWMMGYLNEDLMGTPAVLVTAAITGVGLVVLWRLGPAMDVASFSDAEAASLGVNMRRLRGVLFVAASVLAAEAVVLAGPIAFVGLVCPHAVRLLLGPVHRPLVLGSAMVGAGLILLADAAAVGLDFGQGLLPLGVFTSVLGGPVFVWMLRPQLGRAMN